MRVVATIEARMTSSRLPGKVLMTAGGRPLLQILVERLRLADGLDDIVVATTVNATDDPIAALASSVGVHVFRGSEDDVLGRVAGALRASRADVCVEITGDCPLVDPVIVEEALAEYRRTSASHPYISNSDPQRSVPAGLDVQVFTAPKLFELDGLTSDPADREHVSYGFYRPESNGRWRPRFITHAAAKGGEGLLVTLDYREDYELIRAIYEALAPGDPGFGASAIIEWIRAHPDLHDACLRVRGMLTA